MALFKVITSKAPIITAINYVNRERSVDDESIPPEDRASINCSTDTVKEEMLFIKEQFNKKEGQQYIHSVLSFSEEESEFITPAIALKMMKDLIELEPAFQGFQTTLAVHKEKHLHVHAITNSVSMNDGKKTRWNKYSLKRFQKQLTKYIEDYNRIHTEKLVNALNNNGNKGYNRALKEKVLRDENKSWIAEITEKVMKVINDNMPINKDEFISKLENLGVLTKWDNRKTITFSQKENPKNKIRNTKLKEQIKNIYGIDIPIEKGELENVFERNIEFVEAAGKLSGRTQELNIRTQELTREARAVTEGIEFSIRETENIGSSGLTGFTEQEQPFNYGGGTVQSSGEFKQGTGNTEQSYYSIVTQTEFEISGTSEKDGFGNRTEGTMDEESEEDNSRRYPETARTRAFSSGKRDRKPEGRDI